MPSPDPYVVSSTILFFLSFTSIFLSSTTIWLLYDINHWSVYLRIIFYLALSEIIVDIGYMLIPFYDYTGVNSILMFLILFGNVASSLWTNVISVLVYKIVKFVKSSDIKQNFTLIIIFISIISLAFGSIGAIFVNEDSTIDEIIKAYFWFLTILVAFNAIVYFLVTLKLRKMAFTDTKDPILRLTSKLKYYPLIQIFTRAGVAWYNYQFGLEDQTDTNVTDIQAASLYVFAFFGPLSGILYFLLFLSIRPTAYNHLKRRLNEICCLCGYKNNDDNIPSNHNSKDEVKNVIIGGDHENVMEISRNSCMTNESESMNKSMMILREELDFDEALAQHFNRIDSDQN